MFLARRNHAPRCERCGRVTAPYSVCPRCSSMAPDAVPTSSVEAMIAAAFESSPEQHESVPTFEPVFVPTQSDLEPLGLDHHQPDAEPVPVPEPETYAPADIRGYDPEDVAIPRDADLFVGAGSRWRRIF